jgi:hypothetical protein
MSGVAAQLIGRGTALKRRYDPENVFHLCHNTAPGPSEANARTDEFPGDEGSPLP